MNSNGLAQGLTDTLSLLDARRLHALFQPIVAVAECAVHGHEGLIRGLPDTDLYSASALLLEANAAGITNEFESLAADVILGAYARALGLPAVAATATPAGAAALGAPAPGTPTPGPLLAGAPLLFVNFSARALSQLDTDTGRLDFCDALKRSAMPARTLVIEITQHDRVIDHRGLGRALEFLRGLGVGIGLDAFGDGSSSLRLWAELQPDYVKIDRYFCAGIHTEGKKIQTVKAMLHLADSFGSRMIAQGIEDADDLRVVRDLGIGYVQGYALGEPALEAVQRVPAAALEVLIARDIAVFPEIRRTFHYSPKAAQLLIPAPSVSVHATNHEVLALFKALPHLHAVAVVEDQRPVGLVNRRRFTDKYMLPYYPEIYGRRSCTAFMDREPLVIEASQPMEDLVQILTSEDQRYLNDGYILADAGKYLGLGTAEQLVRSVTELRIEAARHANPLTFLPGNIPISEHIRRLLAGGSEFAASYCDLNNFKPFNDQFGYWHGDKMIRLLASVIVGECDARRDFAGHVGGDDFVVLFQSADWESRCARIVARFNALALTLFDPATRERGFIESEDRAGNPARFPLTTLSVGALTVSPGMFHAPEDVASAAAAAKHRAKKLSGGLYVHRPIDTRSARIDPRDAAGDRPSELRAPADTHSSH